MGSVVGKQKSLETQLHNQHGREKEKAEKSRRITPGARIIHYRHCPRTDQESPNIPPSKKLLSFKIIARIPGVHTFPKEPPGLAAVPSFPGVGTNLAAPADHQSI